MRGSMAVIVAVAGVASLTGSSWAFAALARVPSFSSPSVIRAQSLVQQAEKGRRGRGRWLAAASTETSSSSASPGSLEPSEEWELDIYSRPVVTEGGKKLWELLITDSNGSFKHVEAIPSNMVNSREVRQAVERVIEKVWL
jgi:hypothetical protein